jgi:hypothetical protein
MSLEKHGAHSSQAATPQMASGNKGAHGRQGCPSGKSKLIVFWINKTLKIGQDAVVLLAKVEEVGMVVY